MDAKASSKAHGLGKRLTGMSDGRQHGFAGGGNALSQKVPKATTCKLKATELDSSNSGCLMEPAAMLPTPRLLSGVGSKPLPVQAKRNITTQGPVVRPPPTRKNKS